ncbi:UbiD family decarboxylase [Thermoactinomyces sp. CICC 10522]|nr:UbiD family decarboxylase [Thermoactinomyces sp. CICC 10522]
MVYRDLRSFLEKLEEEGQLVRITQQVYPEPDLGSAARAVNNLGDQAPALLFNNIFGYNNGRVALNVHGSWPNDFPDDLAQLVIHQTRPSDSII